LPFPGIPLRFLYFYICKQSEKHSVSLLFIFTGNLQTFEESREVTGKTIFVSRTNVWAELDSNQRKLSLANLQSASFSHSDIRPYKPVMGIEPATDGLQNRCSTAELHRHDSAR
jgi:hypothetical protein